MRDVLWQKRKAHPGVQNVSLAGGRRYIARREPVDK